MGTCAPSCPTHIPPGTAPASSPLKFFSTTPATWEGDKWPKMDHIQTSMRKGTLLRCGVGLGMAPKTKLCH